MGNGSSKKVKKNPAPKVVSKGRRQDTRHIRLLILRNCSFQPNILDNFCDAVNGCPPSGSLEIKECDIRVAKVPDSGSLPEAECQEIKRWISEWLRQEKIILICLLTQYDINSLTDDNSLENKKIIVFCFGDNPPERCNGCICLDVNLKTATSVTDFEKHMDELFAAIKAETN